MTREEIIAAQNAKDEAAKQLTASPEQLSKEERDTVVLALRSAGATLETIASALGISSHTVGSILKRDDNQKIMAFVREIAKVEAVTNGLLLQRRYMDALRYLPLDRDHAAAHAQFAKAFATIFDKAALAAGEATDRTESRTIAINLKDREEALEVLRAAQEMRRDREAIAVNAASGS